MRPVPAGLLALVAPPANAAEPFAVLTLNDPFRQRLFMKSLGKRLQPALKETLMVLR
jgi:hypothetical protein